MTPEEGKTAALAVISKQTTNAAIMSGALGVVVLATHKRRKTHPVMWWGFGVVPLAWNLFRLGMSIWARQQR